MEKKRHNTAILRMHCPDQVGIIAEITNFINTNGGNIVYLDQYVDRMNSIFYMRVEWELDNFIIPKEKLNDYDLLARYTAGEWDVEIPLIISNHPDLANIGEQFGIPFEVIPITKENKAEQEQKEFELLEKYNIDFIVLARYMQVLSEEFINRYPNRIINIHHSFLPAFVGAKPYHAAYERGVKLIGATSHYVTTELDAGPIIEQDIVRISHKNTVDDLVHKGRDLEKIVLSRAVEKHIQRKILTYKNKTIIFN